MKTTSISDPSKLKVKGWNWGPFIFTFVWAIFHGFWVLGILSIIPGVNLIIKLILALKGNEWAWEKDKNKNYPLFIELQSRWNKIGIIVLFIYSIIFLLILSSIAYPAYREYMHLNINNPV